MLAFKMPIFNRQKEEKGAVKEGDIANCNIEMLYITLLAEKWHPSTFSTLPCFVPILLRVTRWQQNPPSCLPLDCWESVLCVTSAKLYPAKCKGICVPIFAQLLCRDVDFPVVTCLGQMYLFYKPVSLIFSKFTLMKKIQHFLSNRSYYIYQKYSVVKC